MSDSERLVRFYFDVMIFSEPVAQTSKEGDGWVHRIYDGDELLGEYDTLSKAVYAAKTGNYSKPSKEA